MKIPRLAFAMNYIDDDLVVAAEDYKPHRRKWHNRLWLKRGIIAACICIVAFVSIYLLLHQNTPTANDVEPTKVLTFEEAQNCEPFGIYLPSIIADGYRLEKEVSIYNETVMEAVFVNDENGDTLIVRIAPQTLYSDAETGKILYNDDENKSSYLYVDCGDYIVYYSSAKYDLDEVQGFDEMITSSRYFTN